MALYDLLHDLIAKTGIEPDKYASFKPMIKKIIGSFRDELDIAIPLHNPIAITSEYLRSLGYEDPFATPLLSKTTVSSSIIYKILQKIYTNVFEREMLREKLSEGLSVVTKNPLIYKILEVISVIDISIYAVKSNIACNEYGRYGRGIIQIFNTKKLIEATSEFEAGIRLSEYFNTLVHECTHAALDYMFSNQCKPFLEEDTVSQSRFEMIKDQIVKLCSSPKLNYTSYLECVYSPVFHNRTQKILLDTEILYHLTNIQVMDQAYYSLREIMFFNNITIVLEYLLESEKYPMDFYKQTAKENLLVENLLDEYIQKILTEITTSGDSLIEINGEKLWNNEIQFPKKIINSILGYVISDNVIPLDSNENFAEIPLTLKAPAIYHGLFTYSPEKFIVEIPAYLTGIHANEIMLKHFSGQNAEELVFENNVLTKDQDLMDFMTEVVIPRADFFVGYHGSSNQTLNTSIEVMGEDC